MTRPTFTERAEDLSSWLEAMHPTSNGFVDFELPSNIRKDCSREALVEFERYLLDTWPDTDSFGQASPAGQSANLADERDRRQPSWRPIRRPVGDGARIGAGGILPRWAGVDRRGAGSDRRSA